MTRRIFRSICLVALAVFAACLVIILGLLYDFYSDEQHHHLKAQTAMAAQGITAIGGDYLEDLELEGYRLTWIAADGTVLYDNQTDSEKMENHREREEVREALETGYGESARRSSTLMERQLYAAQRLPDGTVVRLSCTQYTILTLAMNLAQPIVVVLFIAVLLSLFLASRLSQKIVAPLNSLDLDAPLSNNGYAEIMPLLRRIDWQQRQLKLQAGALQRKQDALNTLTRSMNEGLALLERDGTILSINPAATQLLGCAPDSVGQNLLTQSRLTELPALLEAAAGGRHSECTVPIGDGSYQIDVSPVLTDHAVSGIVLLLFDVTEKEKAERIRREFTANVSHELKTPLHSISGCAELLQSGLVQPKDQTAFAAQIYTEAQRMIRLVEDIIGLSRLDEGAEGMAREDCDLYAMAQATIQHLSTAARTAGVTLALQGGSVHLRGIPQLLQGIIYNLCDNAIKYNRAGGHVTVIVQQDGQQAVLSVRDNGIGIAPEHQERIFERFYRVDKSHSKEIGGTGLGLSIVKHAALLHRAEIELESHPNIGTAITVRFPL